MEQRLSTRLIHALKLGPEPSYKIAVRAGLHPTQLSKLIHGAERVRENDPRIIRVGRELGLQPNECFEPASDAVAA